MRAWAQATAAIVDASAASLSGYIQWGVSILLGAAGTAIAILWRLDRTQLIDTIKKQDSENAKLSDRLDFAAKKIDAMAAEYVATRTDLAREQARRETREELVRDSGSQPGRIPTNPSMPAVPLPLPPPRGRPYE